MLMVGTSKVDVGIKEVVAVLVLSLVLESVEV